MGRSRSRHRFGDVANTANRVHLFLCVSLLSAAAGCGLYAAGGYSPAVAWLWLASILAGGLYFLGYPAERPARLIPQLSDLWHLALLLAIFAPLYLAFLYDLPVHVSSDEVHVLNVAKNPSADGAFDLFGLSHYFGNPNLIFYVVGYLAEGLGAKHWLQFRTVNALAGLLIIVFTYLFIRMTLESRLLATLGGLLIGSQHALLAISRLGLRDNIALLFEAAALLFLFHGLRARSLFSSFIGGTIAGIACYGYTPGRIAIVIWGLYLALVFFFRSDVIAKLKVTKLAAATGLGFALVIGPLVVSTLQNQAAFPDYHRQQFLFLPEGRALQQAWVNAPSEFAAIRTNLIDGLTAFNNDIADRGNIYYNYGHGFADPLTGALLWIGVIAVLWGRVRKLEDLLAVTGFFTLLFLLSFVITKAPNYTRMLMFLPFTTYLVLQGLVASGQGLTRVLVRWRGGDFTRLRSSAMAAVVVVIAATNVAFYGGYVLEGIKTGNGLGKTIRYIEARREMAPYSFYVVSGPHDIYDISGLSWDWGRDNLGQFIGADQTLGLVAPERTVTSDYRQPATLFMNNELWREFRQGLRARYPDLKLRRLAGDHVAVELGQTTDGKAGRQACAEYRGSLLRWACRRWQDL